MKSVPLTLGLFVLSSAVFAQDIPLSKILVEGERWTVMSAKFPNVTRLTGNADGSMDIWQGRNTAVIRANGIIEEIAAKKDAPVWDQTKVLGEKQARYVIAPTGDHLVAHVDGKETPFKHRSVTRPLSLAIWPDLGHLVIGEKDGAYLWAFRIEKDGSIGPGDRYYSLRTVPGQPCPVTAITLDAEFLLYAATPLGIQVFDPTGRLSGVIPAPAKATMTALAIGGPDGRRLVVACGDTLYLRLLQKKGAIFPK